jgi:hypothetical protein
MASCMHNGLGCSAESSTLHKCGGYFEHSFACENYVCDNHARKSRYGTFCEKCSPAPPVFATARKVKLQHPMAGVVAVPQMGHGAGSAR